MMMKFQLKLYMKFIFSSRLNSLEDMTNVGLYINDLNRFDGSGEMLIVEEQHNQQLEKAFQTVTLFRSQH